MNTMRITFLGLVCSVLMVPAAFAGTIAPGTNTITTSPGPDGAAKICTFTVSGTLTGS